MSDWEPTLEEDIAWLREAEIPYETCRAERIENYIKGMEEDRLILQHMIRDLGETLLTQPEYCEYNLDEYLNDVYFMVVLEHMKKEETGEEEK